jgi:RimJ/RimL family protein N-acetyltransferase
MPDTVFESARLVLRRFRDADLAAWQAHMNTPEVRAHFGGVTSAQASAERFARQKASWSDEEGGWLAIERREDGAFLGNCGNGRIAAEQAPPALQGAPEIGWSLRADCWGHGYATEAATILLAAMFERFGQPRVYSQTSEANRPSWRVMERLGMTREPELAYHDPLYPA